MTQFYMHGDGVAPLFVAPGGHDNVPCERHCKPVVVIDPENSDQVEALIEAVDRASGRGQPRIASVRTRNFSAALRALITPPKPPEPQGLGAMVQDADGHLWHCVSRVPEDDPTWYCDTSRARSAWECIAAVKVLSEGKTP